MQKNLLRNFGAFFTTIILFSYNLTGSHAALNLPKNTDVYNSVENVTFWIPSITNTSFEVRGCLELVNNVNVYGNLGTARQAILSETPDFSRIIFSHTDPSFGTVTGSGTDCDTTPNQFATAFSYGLPGEGYGFGSLFALTPGTRYWFRYSVKFCNDSGTRNWENCSQAKTFTYTDSVTTTGSKPEPTPSPKPTSTKTKKPTPTPKPSNSSSTNPNEDIDDGDVDGVEISIKKFGSNFRFSISDAEPKTKVKIIASKKGSKNVTWNKKTNSNGNLSFSTTRKLKNWTVKIYIDNELEDTIKIK
jgi:hypothetical protein